MLLALLFVSFTSCRLVRGRGVKAGTEKTPWFLQQLTNYQKPFYEALEYWRTNNMLTGAPMMFLDSDTHLTNKVDPSLIKLYASGKSSAIRTQFLSAIAAWRFDHPEVFYVDVTKLLFRVSQDSEGNYKLLFGCISESSLLYDYIDPNKINTMITTFNEKVDEMVKSADGKTSIVDKVTSVHNYLKSKIKYMRQYQFEGDEIDQRDYVYTSYGALVNNKCVCDGFSQAFHIAMNRLNVPSVRIPGDALNERNETQSHSWNVVEMDDQIWYIVDVTYDTTAKTENWLLADQLKTAYTHFPNGNLDSCGVTFYFPPAPMPDQNKWSFKYNFTEKGNLNEIYCSFEGMNSTGLINNHYKLCYKVFAFNLETGTITSNDWIDYRSSLSYGPGEDSANIDINYTGLTVYDSIHYVQFGIAYDDVTLYDLPYGQVFIKCVVNDSDIIYRSPTIATNYSNTNFSMFTALNEPSVRYYSPTPKIFFPGYEFSFVFAMSEELMSTNNKDKENEYSDFKVTLTATSLNNIDIMAGKADKIGEEAVERCVIRDAHLVNKETIAVTIKTSDSYAHDHMDYYVHFNGVKGAYSQKPPKPFNFMVKFFPNNGGTNTCTKMYGSGTIYVAGRPVLITDGDIRNNGENNFEALDQDGNTVSGKGATTSDIALVATRADKESGEEFTATFDISLSLYCRSNLIKPGTYNCPLTIQLPFPQGFDPIANKDVTFEVIHYKDDGVTPKETNTVVVGPTGLLITVSSFSPFKITPKAKSSSKNLLATNYPLYTSTVGGSPSVTIEGKNIKNIIIDYQANQKVSIFVPEGKIIEQVYLNSEPLDVLNSLDSFELPTGSLNERSNTLEIYMGTKAVQELEKDNGVAVFHITEKISAASQSLENIKNDQNYTQIDPIDVASFVIPDQSGGSGSGDSGNSGSGDSGNSGNSGSGDSGDNKPNKKDSKLSTGAIAGIVVGCVVVVGVIVGLCVYFLAIRPKKVSGAIDASS